MISFLVAVLALAATVASEPSTLVLSNGWNGWTSPISYSAPLIAAGVSPVASVAPAGAVASVAPVASGSPLAAYTIADYKYAYGSYQDYYPVVNSALSLPYSFPYAYSADWFNKK